jgi:hypothetical protein
MSPESTNVLSFATYTEQHRPAGTNKPFVAWETLTHAQNPNRRAAHWMFMVTARARLRDPRRPAQSAM